MITPVTEKRMLQAAIALACIVPLSAGLGGMLAGSQMLGVWGVVNLDSHFRYLSGLLLGIGIGFFSAIPHIERQGARVRLLTGIVCIGGLGRLLGMVMHGVPGYGMQGALVMELLVTPLLCCWQGRVARRFSLA